MNPVRWPALVVTIGLLMTGCSGGEPSDDSSASPTPTEQLPLDDPGDGGEVTISQTGLSGLSDPAGRTMVDYAVVLSNSSALVAADVTITVALLDADGEPVVDQVNGTSVVSHRIPVVMPGDSAGLGHYTYVDEDVAELSVSVDTVHWWPVDNSRRPFAELVVSEVSSRWADDGAGEVEFTVGSGYADRLDRPDAVALFRDADGTLLGGSGIGDYTDAAMPAGDSAHTITVDYAVPANADPNRTEVYAYPERLS